MIIKTLKIQHVGRFSTTDAASLLRNTVIFGDNGRGKSTLAAILRSLQTGESGFIMERQTIGAVEEPSISILASIEGANSQCNFEAGVWSRTLEGCEIFDTAFVAMNVYAGFTIDQDQKRSLHKFVLGAANVSLAEKVDTLDAQIRATTQGITEAERFVELLCVSGFTVAQFLELSPVENLDAVITEQESRVEAARAADAIAGTPEFEELIIGAIDSHCWSALLERAPVGSDTDAGRIVREHISMLGAEGERWLSQGTEYLKDDACPYCETSIASNPLVTALRAYFSVAYESLCKDITAAAGTFESDFGATRVAALSSSLESNKKLSPFWGSHKIPIVDETMMEGVPGVVKTFAQAMSAAFEDKYANPLKNVPLDIPSLADGGELEKAIALIVDYNSQVSTANDRITALKSMVKEAPLDVELASLRTLRNVQQKFSVNGTVAVKHLLDLRAAKKTQEGEKKDAKDRLDTSSEKLFADFQGQINRHLENAGCRFSITGTKTVYPGGKPRTDYQLKINERAIDLSPPKGPSNSQWFGNTLSDGDKSALAFAFFIARLELDPDLPGKIVILDDPVTSLDANRRSYTVSQILSLAGRCKQLIVLTHDSPFARQVWDALKKPKASLCIADQDGKSFICDWDIIKATQSDYFNRYDTVNTFAQSPASADRSVAAMSLRVLLEGNLRMRYPEEFPTHEWLGEFIKNIEKAVPPELLAMLRPQLQELVDLNEYSKQFHHDQNPAASTVSIVDSELQAYCRRAIRFVAGVAN